MDRLAMVMTTAWLLILSGSILAGGVFTAVFGVTAGVVAGGIVGVGDGALAADRVGVDFTAAGFTTAGRTDINGDAALQVDVGAGDAVVIPAVGAAAMAAAGSGDGRVIEIGNTGIEAEVRRLSVINLIEVRLVGIGLAGGMGD